MVTIAKVIERDQHGAPTALGKEHALATDARDLRTLCGTKTLPSHDWYYTGDDPGPYVAPLTGKVTCKRCLRILQGKDD